MTRKYEFHYSYIEIGGREIDLWLKLEYIPFSPGARDDVGRKAEPDVPEGYKIEDIQWLDPTAQSPEWEMAPDLIYNIVADDEKLQLKLIDRALGDWRERRAV